MTGADNPFGESRISFRLASSRLVWVTDFSYSETYASLLDGWPREDLNEQIIEQALTYAAAHMVSPAPVYMIPPAKSPVPQDVLAAYERSLQGTQRLYSRPPASTLSPIRCIAHLESEPMSDLFDGSCLKVVWFEQPFFKAPLVAMLAASLRDIPWEKNAVDFIN